MRLLRWPVGLLAALLLLLALCEVVEWPFLQRPLERALSKGLAREVTLGSDFGMRLLGSVRAHSDAVRIGAAAGDPGPAFGGADGVRVVLPYSTVMALARGTRDAPLVVRSLEVERLDVALRRDAEGGANWQFGQPKPGQPKRAASVPEFERLVVRGGEIALDDAMEQLVITASVSTREGSASAPLPSTAASSAPPATSAGPPAANAERRAAAASAGRQAAAAASAAPGAARLAGLHIDARGSFRGAPLAARLQASGLLPLATSSADTPPVPMVLDLRVGQARLQLDGSARDVLRLTALDARFALDGPSLAAIGDVLGATLPSTAPFSMRGQLRKDGAVWGVGVANLVVGKSRLRGDFRYDTTEAVPRLTGALAGERLSLPDLAPALGAKPPQRAKSKAARGARDRLLPQRDFDVPSLRAMNADVKLSIDSVALGTEELANFAPLQGRVRLQDQVLQIEDLVARNSGGELRGALTLDARSEKQPLWHADVRWSGVQLERFVKTRNPRSKEAPRTAGKAAGTPASKTAKQGAAPGQGGYVSGVLGGAAKLRGSGRSVAGMMASLDGSAQAWVSDGRVSHLLVELSGIDLAESLGLLVTGDDTLPVRCAVARFAVKDGVARPEVAVIDTPDTTLLVTGEISLVDERLALDVAARPKDMSLVALRGPVHVRGSFGKPQVELDKARMGLRLAAAAALAVVAAPVAGLLALVDLGESERAVCGDALAQIKGPAPKQLQGEVAAKKK